MQSPPLLSVRQATISFAKVTLFEDLSFNIFSRDRICLIGKNGVGKTSLMNVIAGDFELDHGERWIAPNSTLGYLTQSENLPKDISIADFLMSDLSIDEHKSYLIDIVCEQLKIDKNAITQNLSGGQKRRVVLARALILEPDILLLDEPTNHLDLEIIQWLENYLCNFQGALLVISHDRKFLEKVSNKVFWLRSGLLKVNPNGYGNFDEWSQGIIDYEARELNNLEKKVALESGWLQTGVTGRRKRNIGRLHYLQELRSKLNAQRKLVFADRSKINIQNHKFEEDAPQVILSFHNVSKSFPTTSTTEAEKINPPLIDKFTLKILRGERIGIIGNNGSGKSTMLKLMIREIDPDQGRVKPAKDLALSYFDQSRSAIKPDSTIQEILCDSGGDYVKLANNKTKHICGYLQDFLFDPNDRKTLTGTLSGGQQNRLLLAKTLATPGNFMILDEPTNDLDMDSLDMLSSYLEKYQGTLIIVSHDRDFLDNVATSILAFEGDGVITNHIGGYSDYLEYKKRFSLKPDILSKKPNLPENNNNNIKSSKPQKTFSYKHKIELGKLPDKIEKLEVKISDLSSELSNTEDRNSANLAHISIEISKYQEEKDKAETRWIELEELKEKSS